jgi:hypothetical protein
LRRRPWPKLGCGAKKKKKKKSTQYLQSVSSVRNLRTRHAVVIHKFKIIKYKKFTHDNLIKIMVASTVC